MKVVGVFEHRVIVECLNDYETTRSLTMAKPETNSNSSLISSKEMLILLDFVSKNPEIEFISLPRVRDASDI